MTILSFLHTVGLLPSGGWVEYLSFDIVVLVVILVGSKWIGGREPVTDVLIQSLKKYLWWGALQQVLVTTVFLVLTEVLHLKLLWAILLCAPLFGLAHFPHPMLVPTTTALGFVFLLMFVEFRNFYAQALSHGVLATFLMLYMPRAILTEFSTWKVYADRNRAFNKSLP